MNAQHSSRKRKTTMSRRKLERETTSTTSQDNQYRDVNIFQRTRIEVHGSLEPEKRNADHVNTPFHRCFLSFYEAIQQHNRPIPRYS